MAHATNQIYRQSRVSNKHEVSRSNTQLLHNHVQHNKHFVSPNTHIVIEYSTCFLAIQTTQD